MFILYTFIIFFAGCFLHFLYEISGYKKPFALFAAVNESVWEHVKIAVVPTLLFLVIYLIFGKYELNNFLVAAAGCLLSIVVLIPAVFYLFEFLTKKVVIWLDIVEFFLDILASQYLFSILILGPHGNTFSILTTICACLIIALITFTTFRFTFNPPQNFLFKDSRNGKYGLKAAQKMKHHHHRH